MQSKNWFQTCVAHGHFLKQPRMSEESQRQAKQRGKAFDLQGFLESRTAAVNTALDRFLPATSTKPATIHKAMRYSLFAGGKHLRPILGLAAAEAFRRPTKHAM